MKYEKGDLIYLPGVDGWPKEYAIITGLPPNSIDPEYRRYELLSLINKENYRLLVDWVDKHARNIG